MIISVIVAVAENYVIGKDNKLVWHLPADMKYFKEKTTGHPIIMGRKTYEALGKPLPNRTNIVITRRQNFHPEGFIIVHSLEEAVETAGRHETEEVFIIGGGEIYQQSLALADRIYVSRIYKEFEGDTYFPVLSSAVWKLTSENMRQPDEKNPHRFAFQVFEKI